jgi:deoxyribodipyrimidine photo-lyase
MKQRLTFFWHRRDLRIEDNAGLFSALKHHDNVIPIFIFDRNILDLLEDKSDARLCFIHYYVEKLKGEYEQLGTSLLVKYGKPEEIWQKLIDEFDIEAVYTNRDYEPYAQQRDKTLFEYFQSRNIAFKGYKDHVIFEKGEVLKDDGKPYTVFTPYSKKWKTKLNDFYLKSYPVVQYLNHLKKCAPFPFISLNEMGFSKTAIEFPSEKINEIIIKQYHEKRDIPSVKGTTRLSVHLRFGTISIRKLASIALKINEKYLNEIIWRDFYQMIIFYFPNSVTQAFKPEYDRIKWDNNEVNFKKWCEGKTGYPIVDAGMRELNSTGFMHNRVRMITASFLTKHLLIDWRWGERYFAAKLLDFELASNVGGWQWAASSGCDAAPYFRVFNPELQTEKFDPQYIYIKRWVQEFKPGYLKPIVEHKFARERVLNVFQEALKK